MSKIVIIGAGFVGSTAAYALMLGGTVKEIVLVDKIKEKAHGEAMDLSHGASFVKPLHIHTGDYEDCHDADLILITAGAQQMPGQSRLELVRTNSSIMETIVTKIREQNNNAILVIATNPVDIISYVAWKASGLPSSRVIGTGTVLDTSRFRHLLSIQCGTDPRNIHAYVVGEHGDSEVPLWSTANVGGVPLDQFCVHCEKDCSSTNREEINQKVRHAAYEIIDGKGATYYAIGLAIRRIVESILRNEHSVLTVSSHVEDFYGIKDIYLSYPCILGRKGVEKRIPLQTGREEREPLLRSAKIVKETILGQAGDRVKAGS